MSLRWSDPVGKVFVQSYHGSRTVRRNAEGTVYVQAQVVFVTDSISDFERAGNSPGALFLSLAINRR